MSGVRFVQYSQKIISDTNLTNFIGNVDRMQRLATGFEYRYLLGQKIGKKLMPWGCWTDDQKN